ncbi:hypothetical protein [Rickettsiella massiliensis]|uniref:hypothetical protein n=1 Tax=Rickettsiella massiliensis TaxID=676517 RepID=UPI00029AAB9A|nr:hypothetical protein [Rickettsiella massiliensis]
MFPHILVLDANILIRAVLGNKLKKIVKIADEEIYKEYMPQAKERMKNRDIED